MGNPAVGQRMNNQSLLEQYKGRWSRGKASPFKQRLHLLRYTWIISDGTQIVQYYCKAQVMNPIFINKTDPYEKCTKCLEASQEQMSLL